jgi:hypothetical protein
MITKSKAIQVAMTLVVLAGLMRVPKAKKLLLGS